MLKIFSPSYSLRLTLKGIRAGISLHIIFQQYTINQSLITKLGQVLYYFPHIKWLLQHHLMKRPSFFTLIWNHLCPLVINMWVYFWTLIPVPGLRNFTIRLGICEVNAFTCPSVSREPHILKNQLDRFLKNAVGILTIISLTLKIKLGRKDIITLLSLSMDKVISLSKYLRPSLRSFNTPS